MFNIFKSCFKSLICKSGSPHMGHLLGFLCLIMLSDIISIDFTEKS